MTRAASLVHEASSVIEIDEVLVATTAEGQRPTASARTLALRAGSSGTASITTSACQALAGPCAARRRGLDQRHVGPGTRCDPADPCAHGAGSDNGDRSEHSF